MRFHQLQIPPDWNWVEQNLEIFNALDRQTYTDNFTLAFINEVLANGSLSDEAKRFLFEKLIEPPVNLENERSNFEYEWSLRCYMSRSWPLVEHQRRVLNDKRMDLKCALALNPALSEDVRQELIGQDEGYARLIDIAQSDTNNK